MYCQLKLMILPIDLLMSNELNDILHELDDESVILKIKWQTKMAAGILYFVFGFQYIHRLYWRMIRLSLSMEIKK